MVASLSMTSGAELRYIAGKLRKAAARDLTRELRKGMRDAVKPLQKEIKAEALASLPRRGGYNVAMSKDVKVSVVNRASTAGGLTVRVYAIGRTQERDVRTVNAGRLRHPVFGHRTRWTTTTVRPGFVDRPVDRLSDQVEQQCADAAGRVLEQIAA